MPTPITAPPAITGFATAEVKTTIAKATFSLSGKNINNHTGQKQAINSERHKPDLTHK